MDLQKGRGTWGGVEPSSEAWFWRVKSGVWGRLGVMDGPPVGGWLFDVCAGRYGNGMVGAPRKREGSGCFRLGIVRRTKVLFCRGLGEYAKLSAFPSLMRFMECSWR
jgi:hypothetical protein